MRVARWRRTLRTRADWMETCSERTSHLNRVRSLGRRLGPPHRPRACKKRSARRTTLAYHSYTCFFLLPSVGNLTLTAHKASKPATESKRQLTLPARVDGIPAADFVLRRFADSGALPGREKTGAVFRSPQSRSQSPPLRPNCRRFGTHRPVRNCWLQRLDGSQGIIGP